MQSSPARVVQWLKACGEPSRLRLLALCERDALSVTDLAQALGQSEPRVSRHLRILSEAGLIERHRAGQWVQYRLAREAAAASFTQGLLAQLDRRDEQLQQDRSAARHGGAAGPLALCESRLGRALAALLQASPPGPSARTLIAGVTNVELLAAVGGANGVALAVSARAARALRAQVSARGLKCRVLESPLPLTGAELERAGSPFDLIVLDRAAAEHRELPQTLAAARAALSAEGRLWLFGSYDSLEASQQRVVEHPLARVRRLLYAAGLSCERLSPLEADGQHVLAACAR